MAAIIISSIVFLYAVLMGLTWELVSDDFDEALRVFLVLLWPLVLPTFTGVAIGKWFKEWRTRPERVANAMKQ